MNTSQNTKEISAALVAFHKAVGKIKKDSNNPFFNSSYASLSGILEAINEPLTTNGLTVTQFPEGENGLTTRLMHISGEWMEATYFMKPSKNDPQGMGSAITYQRRYAIGAILSLNIDEDDDANAASQPQSQKKTYQQPEKKTYPQDDKPWLNENTDAFTKAINALQNGSVTISQIEKKYKLSKKVRAELESAIPQTA